MKKISVILSDELYEKLRRRSFVDNSRSLGDKIRNILHEALKMEQLVVDKSVDKPPFKLPFKSIRESNLELKKILTDRGLYKKRGEMSSDDYT